MKKLISFALVLALCLALAPAALAVSAKVSDVNFTLNGQKAKLQAYLVDQNNYVRLRDLAMLLRDTDSRFSVRFEDETKTVYLVSGEDYVPLGDELPETAEDLSDQVSQVAQTVVINGKTAEGMTFWTFGGSNYFKLRDLSPRLNFRVTWDQASYTANIESATLLLPRPDVKAAASYREVLDSLVSNRYYEVDEEAVEAPAAAPEPTGDRSAAATNAAAEPESGGGGDDYSGTNVQVEGVDEGDIVKTDGRYIYVLNGEYHLTVIQADGPKSRVVSQTQVGESDYSESEQPYYRYSSYSKYPQEMFLWEDRLAILSSYNRYGDYQDGDGWHWESENHCCVDIYDVSDPAAPRLLDSLGQDGWLLSSRLLDGRLYLVSNLWVYSYDEDDPETYVPVLYRNGAEEPMAAERIYLCGTEESEYVVAAVYDLERGAQTDSLSLLGSGDEIYMSGSSLYVLGSEWDSQETETHTESVYTVTTHRNGRSTSVYRFDLSDGLRLAASARVPGYIDDQFSADEYDGYFRLVTTRSENVYRTYADESFGFVNYQWDDSESSSGLYILDMDLNLVGSVTDLAPGEQIYSARFDGDTAYFTTFRTVDPLFTVDLSDPYAPVVRSALKISGFSEYLHNWTDGRLFGFGREADEDSGWAEELKLVMFNTSDPENVYAEQTLTLEAYYSEALYDHHAFFIDPVKNLIGFLTWDDEYFIFSYDPQTGFQELCRFTFDTGEWSVRGLYIGDYAYIVGSEQLMVVDMTTWAAPTGVNIAV